MREIVLDTETTGLDPAAGHRIIEIGCVELYNLMPTGKVFQVYINPERDVPEEASAISGITTAFLLDKPLFSHIVEDFLLFIQDSPLVIHNAGFDIKFLNHELARLGKPIIPITRAIDTVALARKKYPGSPASLDALCRRFQIDLSVRDKHGALVDAKLLAKVYLELQGGRQRHLGFSFGESSSIHHGWDINALLQKERPLRPARPHEPSEEEKVSHQAFLKLLKNALWLHEVPDKA